MSLVPIIGIAGKAGAGKSTLADMMTEHYAVHPIAFADPLRSMVMPAALLAFNGDQAKTETYLYEKKDEKMPVLNTSARQLYRDFGDTMRSHDKDVFLTLAKCKMNILTERYKHSHYLLSGSPPSDNMLVPFVFDDVRYENEARFIIKRGGVIVSIERNEKDLRQVPEHSSENGIADSLIDLTIQNTGSLDDLRQWADTICEMYEIPAFTEEAETAPRVH